MDKPTPRERLSYRFDKWMSRGPIALIALLGIATVVLVLVVFGLVSLFTLFGIYPNDDPKTNPADTLWGNLMRTLDPGTMGGDSGWLFRVLMLAITVGGLIIVASLIGIISGAFDSKVEELRKGRSRVLETDHTLILGWSSKVFPIVAEIVIANESRGKSAIVILADKDKVEMEDEIFAKLGKTGRSKIICRTGDPMNLSDLEISNPHTARSIILIAPDGASDPDSDVIKTALALTNNPRRKGGKYHIVGEIEHAANLEAANLVGRDEAHWVLGSDLIARITVQSCRQSGLSAVYTELLDFDGDEIYFTTQPSLHGSTYFDTQLAFATSSVIGILKGGVVHINPASETLYEFGDQLVVIAEDDSTIVLASAGAPDATAISDSPAPAAQPERTLVLGYNRGLGGMLKELDEYVPAGSSVTVLADVDEPAFPSFSNLTVTFQRGDATSRALLDALEVQTYDHIIVLAYRDTLDAQRADGKTLITLLQLRDIEARAGADLNIVSEMLDDRNRELAEVTNADDFIVSDKLISLLLAQVSENEKLTEVFDTLFSSSGSEVYLNPAELYVTPGSSVDFYTVLEAARRRGHTAIGYRVASEARNSHGSYGVRVNPTKTQRITFGQGDKVIVLAED
ncbi:MAG: NAD-binding protein [Salinibacterium sp.]|nr:NAD-binding protein [Salinibacterium sp.]